MYFSAAMVTVRPVNRCATKVCPVRTTSVRVDVTEVGYRDK